jgi:hypothetical protein
VHARVLLDELFLKGIPERFFCRGFNRLALTSAV